jgi:sporulation protein YlmC with PRC-barrel domain
VEISRLFGKKVITIKANILGEVKSVEVDTGNWAITHLQVKLTDVAATDLGFKKRFRSSTICLPVNLIKAVGEVITVDKSIEELSKISEITECTE